MARRKVLVDASALEAIVAADPDTAWSVLDDFLLENDDARGAVVAHEMKRRRPRHASR